MTLHGTSTVLPVVLTVTVTVMTLYIYMYMTAVNVTVICDCGEHVTTDAIVLQEAGCTGVLMVLMLV